MHWSSAKSTAPSSRTSQLLDQKMKKFTYPELDVVVCDNESHSLLRVKVKGEKKSQKEKLPISQIVVLQVLQAKIGLQAPFPVKSDVPSAWWELICMVTGSCQGVRPEQRKVPPSSTVSTCKTVSNSTCHLTTRSRPSFCFFFCLYFNFVYVYAVCAHMSFYCTFTYVGMSARMTYDILYM